MMNIRKGALLVSSTLAASWALAASVSAHTDSLGFVINPGSGDGLFNVDIFYGSWHNPVGQAEGAVDLTLEDGTPVDTETFQLYPGFNGVANGVLPPGLVPGVNYFFPDYMGGLTGDPSGHYIFAFQYVTFVDLVAGAYRFGYNAGSSFTIDWAPSDPMINAGSFVIGPNGQLIVGGVAGAVIDTSQVLFTAETFANSNEVTFNGGVLQMSADVATLGGNFVVNETGGTIDANGQIASFSGDFSGAGVLTLVGGTTRVTGTNTHGGFLVNHATLQAGDDAALGAEGAALTLHHGVFAPTQSMSVMRPVVASSNHGAAFDVAEDLVLTLEGTLSGDGCLYKRGLGALDLRANGANSIGACVEEGLMAFNAVFNGNVWVEPNGRISGAGLIQGDVEVAGVLSPGNSPGQLVVAGSVTLLPGSVLEIEIDGPIAGVGAGRFDTLILTGATSVFTAGGVLSPMLRGISAPANNDFTPEIGDTFEIVSAEGGVTGSFESVAQPLDGLAANTRFDVLYGANSVLLAVTPASYALALSEASGNARSAASGLETIRPDAGQGAATPQGALFAGLMGFDVEALGAVFHQISGEVHPVSLELAHRSGRASRDAVLERLNSERGDARVWGESIGAYGEVDGDGNANGWTYRGVGLITGADARIGQNWRVGAAVSFVEADTRGGPRAQAQSYQLAGYARYVRGDVFANIVAAYAQDRYDLRRVVTLNTGAHALWADADGESYAGDIEVGRSFDVLSGNLDLIGAVSLETVRRGDLSETGDAALALSFDDEDSEVARLRLGARYERSMSLGEALLRPYAQLHAVYVESGESTRVQSQLHGAGFSTASPAIGRSGVQTGLGVVADVGTSFSLFAHYRGELSKNHNAHGARVGVSVGW